MKILRNKKVPDWNFRKNRLEERMMGDKRKDYISWDEYFMGLAHLSALRSKDPNTQVGAAIVDENHRVVSVGYNGFPTGVSDDEFP